MPPHTSQEFDYAKQTMDKLVEGSCFFPWEASREDWFGSNISVDSEGFSSSSLTEGVVNERNHRDVSPRQKRSRVPTIHEKDIIVGSLLGSGGFCEVRSAYVSNLKHPRTSSLSEVSTSCKNDEFIHEIAKEFLCRMTNNSENESKSMTDEIYNKNDDIIHSPTKTYALKYLSPTKFLPKKANDYCPPPAVNKEFERAIADLVTEARFLSMLSHPNIITMHYVSEGKLENVFNCGETETAHRYLHQYGYFLLLDQLHETLSHRIKNAFIPEILPTKSSSSLNSPSSNVSSWWRIVIPSDKKKFLKSGGRKNSDVVSKRTGELRRYQRFRNSCSSINDSANNCGNCKQFNPKHHLAHRLSSLRGIASALAHMHKKGIISRDVKSDNIGFQREYHPLCSCGRRCIRMIECCCYDDIPKIFDFGLCRELKEKNRIKSSSPETDGFYCSSQDLAESSDTFKLTGLTGSRRWMAPEVALSLPYNQKADVYSFGLVLYYVASLIVPFDGFSLSQIEKEVVIGGHRPDTVISTFSRHSSSSGKKKPCRNKARGTKNKSNVLENREKQRQLAFKTLRVWPNTLKSLVEECWDRDMRCRPEMCQVEERLDKCIEELKHENVSLVGSVLRRASIRRSSCGGSSVRRPSLSSFGNDADEIPIVSTIETSSFQDRESWAVLQRRCRQSLQEHAGNLIE